MLCQNVGTIWHLMSVDLGPPTQLRAQNAKWKNDNKVLREVRRGRKMGTNCVAGSARGRKMGTNSALGGPGILIIYY